MSIEDRKDYWPQLKIQDPRWKGIFGNGENWKLNLWFCVPGIWNADQHKFGFEIELWHEAQGNDWRLTKANLPKWLKVLKTQNFDWEVYETWNKIRKNTPASEIDFQPKRITAWATEGEVSLDKEPLQNEDELLNHLAAQAKQYAKVVESLGT